MNAPAEAPLRDVRVLDLSQGIAGGYCTAILRELGASVVKCEPPGGEWTRRLDPIVNGTPALFASVNAGKRSIVIDLKAASGADLMKRAAARADVLVESMRPGVMARLGLAPDVLRDCNPALVHTSITGFGETGPWAGRPAVDVIAQALGGLLAATGARGGDPVRAPLVADLHSGALAAIGTLARLHTVARGGHGGRVDANLVESVMGLQRPSLVAAALTGRRPARLGSDAEYAAPNGAFRALDGHIAVAANLPGRWEAFCGAIDASELAVDPRFEENHDRVVNAEELRDEIERRLATRRVADVVAALEAHDVPCAPVVDIVDAAASEHFAARGRYRRLLTADGGAIDYPAVAPGVGCDDDPAPDFVAEAGEHTEELLSEWGVPDAEIRALIESGAVTAARKEAPAS